jgi:hypothetical protein
LLLLLLLVVVVVVVVVAVVVVVVVLKVEIKAGSFNSGSMRDRGWIRGYLVKAEGGAGGLLGSKRGEMTGMAKIVW